MNINGVCHSVLCGQLERLFRGRTILYTTSPGSALWKPCKSRAFPRLIVHARPPFPFTFRFLPPVNSGGTVRAVFCPVGFWDEHTAADRTAFQVLSPENLCFQRPVLRQDRPAEPLTADGERNGLGAGVAVPVVKSDTIPALITAALPPDKAVRLFPLRRRHAVEGAVRLAFYGRQSSVWIFFHVSSVSLLPFSPKRLPALARSPDFGTFCPEVRLLAVLPLPGYSFSDGHSVFKVRLIDELR